MQPLVWGADEKSRKMNLAVFNVYWDKKIISQASRDNIITPLYKSGDKRVCDNYRGLCLNEHQGKVFERMVKGIPDAILESQCGFVPGRSTMQATFLDKGLSSEYRSR